MVLTKIVLLLMVVVACLAAPTKLSFKKNQQFQYKLNADLDARGKTDDSQNPTGGAVSQMNAIFVAKCVDIKGSSYLFITNMFNTKVSVDQKKETAFEVDPSGGTALGYDMYFQQEESGNITQIWYQKGDSMDLVKIKVGAINSLQTFVVAPESKSLIYQPDPVGSHTSNFTAKLEGDSLTITKGFTQDNFFSFSDPNVHKSNVNILGSQATTVHPSGYIQKSRVVQTTLFVNQGQKSSQDLGLGADETGFNINLRSAGSLNVELQQNALGDEGIVFNSNITSFEGLMASDLAKETLSGVAKQIVQFAAMPDIDFEEELEDIMAAEAMKDCLNKVDNVVRFLRFNPNLVSKVGDKIDGASNKQLDRLLYILANVGNSQAEHILIKKALFSTDKNLKLRAVLHTASALAPASADLIESVQIVYTLSGNDETIEKTSILALGSLIKRVPSEIKGKYMEFLGAELDKENEKPTLRAALQNAGVPSLYMQQKLDDSDFPYNRSYNKDVKIGGSKVSLDLEGTLFAGTNFDCNHPTFNYELLGRVQADGHVLGYSKTVFLAEAIYGKANGAVIGNHLLLKVWDTVIYEKDIPMIDCSEHTYPLAHTAPGFSVSYIVWVSVIPVTFKASATVTLDLSWGWKICDSDLSAMAELIPVAEFSFGGGAEINLFIIQAGVELVGSFNIRVSPQVYIHGSECSVGFDVRKITVPMSAKFDAYFRWKSCKFLIFDCKWGKHNEYDFWTWSSPATDEVLFKKEWKIAGKK